MIKLKCRYCGIHFYRKTARKKYCSAECTDKGYKKALKRYYQKNRSRILKAKKERWNKVKKQISMPETKVETNVPEHKRPSSHVPAYNPSYKEPSVSDTVHGEGTRSIATQTDPVIIQDIELNSISTEEYPLSTPSSDTTPKASVTSHSREVSVTPPPNYYTVATRPTLLDNVKPLLLTSMSTLTICGALFSAIGGAIPMGVISFVLALVCLVLYIYFSLPIPK